MRFPFHFFKARKSFSTKLYSLEKKILAIEAILNDETAKNEVKSKTEEHSDTLPTIKIEHLQVDKIIIQRLDYANNFGQLGIKELTGKLNIGTSYEGDITKKVNEKLSEKTGPQSKLNLRGKKELD
ncbi:MAG: hypothetical protein Q8906_04430 [Bacillota bacterium]|nr:hypothetical protein [Bacillota bacterium]MDP4169834.1 hypothetical protein [Bacillota bacterium]